MLFIPYKVDFPFRERHLYASAPVFSFLIGIACVLVFSLQLLSSLQELREQEYHCENYLNTESRPLFKDKLGLKKGSQCRRFLDNLRSSLDISSELEFFAYKKQLTESEQALIALEVERFDALETRSLTRLWWFDPKQANAYTPFTSTLLHADLSHFLINMLFFFVFSIAVEQVIGSFFYAALYIFSSLATAYAYRWGLFNFPSGIPTIGMSGFISALISCLAIIFPFHRIKIFVWLFIFVKTFHLPLLVLAAIYFLMDIYGLRYLAGETNVNYLSHIVGAMVGAIFGSLYAARRLLLIRNNKIDLAKSNE